VSYFRPFVVTAERPTPEQAQALIWDAAALIAELLHSYENKDGSEPARQQAQATMQARSEDDTHRTAGRTLSTEKESKVKDLINDQRIARRRMAKRLGDSDAEQSRRAEIGDHRTSVVQALERGASIGTDSRGN